jgi:hypothetical protein
LRFGTQRRFRPCHRDRRFERIISGLAFDRHAPTTTGPR